MLRPHLTSRNLSFRIATQLQRFWPSSSFCIVCILLFSPIRIRVCISLVLKCKEYIFSAINPFGFSIFLINILIDRFHHGKHGRPSPRIQPIPDAGPLTAFMFRKSPGCPLSSSLLILYVQQSVYLTWTQTSDSLGYSDSGRRVCHFRDSSHLDFSPCTHLCSRALSAPRGLKEEHESVHVCVCV